MAPGIGHETVRRLAHVRADAQLVAHRAAEHQQRGLVARQRRDKRFQRGRRAVVAEDVVAFARARDRGRHGRGAPRHDVAFLERESRC